MNMWLNFVTDLLPATALSAAAFLIKIVIQVYVLGVRTWSSRADVDGVVGSAGGVMGSQDSSSSCSPTSCLGCWCWHVIYCRLDLCCDRECSCPGRLEIETDLLVDIT